MGKLGIAEIYENAASLRDKVTYGDEGVDEKLLVRAEAAIAGMQDEYLDWAEKDIQAVERLCAAMPALPESERTYPLRLMFEIVHGMKGQGGSFGFPLITQIADSFGRFIEGRQACGSREMDVIQVHVNALRLVVAERLTNDGGYAGEKMLLGLQQVIDKFARHD